MAGSAAPPENRGAPMPADGHATAPSPSDVGDERARRGAPRERESVSWVHRIWSLSQPLVTLLSPRTIQLEPAWYSPTTASSMALPIRSSWEVIHEYAARRIRCRALARLKILAERRWCCPCRRSDWDRRSAAWSGTS